MAKRNRGWMAGQRKFDSKFEEDLHEGVLAACEYHPKEKVAYTVAHKYEPDFVFTRADGFKYIIEAKGRFVDSTEAAKYVHIKKALDPFSELIFLFWDPDKPFPNAKVRKDGTKRSHKDWADKNKIRWYTKETIHLLLEET